MPLSIDTSSPLPVAEKDFGYAVVIEASGGTAPYQWTLVSGSIPAGLVLDLAATVPQIALSGVPSVFGLFAFTLRITDSLGASTFKTFSITVAEKQQRVTLSTRLIDPETGLGVQAQAITAEVYDVRHQLRDTFVFPVGVVESQDAEGFLYVIHDYSVADRMLFKGNFLHVKWTAIFNGNSLTPWWELVPLASEIAPIIEPARQPYASVAEANRYFEQIFDKRERWATFNEREVDQLTALVAASDHIDLEKFKGFQIQIFSAHQKLRQFPRYMPLGERARGLLGDTEIPIRVMNACCEQALWLLEQRQQGHDLHMRQFMQNSGVTGMTRGTQQENWNISQAQNSKLCPDAYWMLQPFLAVGMDDTPGAI